MNMNAKKTNRQLIDSNQTKLDIRKQALQTLIDLKVIIPFNNSLQLFHGRVSDDNEKFYVKDNASDTDYYHESSIYGLHTSNYDIARLYAIARAKEKYEKSNDNPPVDAQIQVHRIISITNNTFIFDICKIYNIEEIEQELIQYLGLTKEDVEQLKINRLNVNQMTKLKDAFSILISTYTIPELMPELFKNEQNIKILKDCKTICTKNLKQGKEPLIYDDDLEKYLQKLPNLNADLIQSIAGCLNTYNTLTHTCDLPLLFSKLQSGFNLTENCSLNMQLFKNFLLQLNICGIHQKVWRSDIVKPTNFDDYFFFDTSKINTEPLAKKIKEEQQREQ